MVRKIYCRQIQVGFNLNSLISLSLTGDFYSFASLERAVINVCDDYVDHHSRTRYQKSSNFKWWEQSSTIDKPTP